MDPESRLGGASTTGPAATNLGRKLGLVGSVYQNSPFNGGHKLFDAPMNKIGWIVLARSSIGEELVDFQSRFWRASSSRPAPTNLGSKLALVCSVKVNSPFSGRNKLFDAPMDKIDWVVWLEHP